MSEDFPESAAITIIDFWAEWCGVCRMIEPVVERVVSAHDDVTLRKVNVVEEAAMADSMGVRALPTLVFTAADGRELHRMSGAMTGARIKDGLLTARAGL
jgi:thioredoxin 1